MAHLIATFRSGIKGHLRRWTDCEIPESSAFHCRKYASPNDDAYIEQAVLKNRINNKLPALDLEIYFFSNDHTLVT